MYFEKLKTVPTSQELLDKAFSRGTRAMMGKEITGPASRRDANESMVLTSANILTDNMKNIVRMYPNLDSISLFYADLVDILVGIDELKKSLGQIDWAASKIHSLSHDFVGRLRKSQDPDSIRREAMGRISSVVYSVEKDLEFLNEARNKLRKLPDVKEEPTIIVAGFPNVGKSSFVSLVSTAKPEISTYPFTTKGLLVGHFEHEKLRYQILDTPGLLDRPIFERNEIELQAITALTRLDAVVLFIIDPSQSCGYLVEDQLNLAKDIEQNIELPIIIVANKSDRDDFSEISGVEYIMSTLDGTGTEEILMKLINMLPKPKPPGIPEKLRDLY